MEEKETQRHTGSDMRRKGGAAQTPAPSFIDGVIKREAHKLTAEIEHIHAQSGPETHMVRKETKASPINPAEVSGADDISIGFNSAQNESPTLSEEIGRRQAQGKNTQRSPEEATRAKDGLWPVQVEEEPARSTRYAKETPQELNTIAHASAAGKKERAAVPALKETNSASSDAAKGFPGVLGGGHTVIRSIERYNRDRFTEARSGLAALHRTAGEILRSVETNELQIREMLARKPINANESLIRVPPTWHVEEVGDSHEMFSLPGLKEAERRLHMAKTSGNGSEVAKWLVCVAELYEYAGKYSEALELCEQCSQNELIISADGEIGRVLLMAQFRQGLVGLKMGDTAMAIAVLEDCFQAASSQFDVPGLCLMQLNLCHLYLAQHSTIAASSPQQTEEQSAADHNGLISQNTKMAADKERMLAAAQTLLSDYRYFSLMYDTSMINRCT